MFKYSTEEPLFAETRFPYEIQLFTSLHPVAKLL